MAGEKLLIVEDEANIRNLLEMRAKIAGYQTRTAANGVLGFAAFKAFQPDLVITDHKMPGGMNGTEMAKAIKELPGMEDLPVMILTGSVVAAYSFSVEFDGVGNVVTLPKPFSVRTVFELVEKLLQQGRADGDDAGTGE